MWFYPKFQLDFNVNLEYGKNEVKLIVTLDNFDGE